MNRITFFVFFILFQSFRQGYLVWTDRGKVLVKKNSNSFDKKPNLISYSWEGNVMQKNFRKKGRDPKCKEDINKRGSTVSWKELKWPREIFLLNERNIYTYVSSRNDTSPIRIIKIRKKTVSLASALILRGHCDKQHIWHNQQIWPLGNRLIKVIILLLEQGQWTLLLVYLRNKLNWNCHIWLSEESVVTGEAKIYIKCSLKLNTFS